MDLRKEPTITTLRDHHKFLSTFLIFFLDAQISVAVIPHQINLSLLQIETITENHTVQNTEINNLWEAQSQCIHLNHSSCIYDSEDNVTQAERWKIRKSSVKQFHLEMAV